MSKVKVCHITSVHSAEDVRILQKECKSLANNGYEVVLLSLRSKSYNSKGVEIVGLNQDGMSRFKRFFTAPRLLLKKALEIDACIYHLHDPELLLIAGKLKRKGKTVIYDAHEDLPRQIFSKHYIHPLLKKPFSFFAGKWLRKVSSSLDGVVAATEVIKESFKLYNNKVLDVKNYPLTEKFPEPPDFSSRQNAVCYAGGIFMERGIFQMLDAVGRANIVFHLAGTFSPPSLKDEAMKHPAWSKVVFHAYVSSEKLLEILALSRVGLVLLHPLRSYQDALPVKMFEYMAAGIAVIASDFTLWKEIIEGNNCGICVDPMDIDKIADAISYLINNPDIARQMGENGRKAVSETYNWRNEGKKLIDFYRNLCHDEHTTASTNSQRTHS